MTRHLSFRSFLTYLWICPMIRNGLFGAILTWALIGGALVWWFA